MAVIYRTAGAWGAGKGSNLSAAEVDENFWDHAQRILALETDLPSPHEIADIIVNGSQMTIVMDDATTFGPFTLPTATFHWRADWAADTDYFVNDIVKVANNGIYLVRADHHTVALSTFDPSLLVGGVAAYYKMFALPGSSVMNWKGDWTAATAYLVDDVVYIAGDGSYIVNVDHTSDDTFDPDFAFGGVPAYTRLEFQTGSVSGGSDLWDPVQVATTSNVILSGEQTFDGVLTSASRVLARKQINQSENGIYVTAAGAWTRATDADTVGEFTTFKQVLGGLIFYLTRAPAVLGTDPIAFYPLVAPDNPRIFLTITDAAVTLSRHFHSQRALRFDSASAQTLNMDGFDNFAKGRGFWVTAVGAGAVTVTPSGGVVLDTPAGMLTAGALVCAPQITYYFFKYDDLKWSVQQGIVAASGLRNDSSVSGATIKDALETLAGGGSLAASDVSNDSASVTGVTVADALDTLQGEIAGAGSGIPLSYLDTDGTLAANSDTKVATQKATKTYADTKVAKAGDTMTGALQVPAGSVTAPSLAAGEVGTGLYLVATGILGLTAAGVAAFEADSSRIRGKLISLSDDNRSAGSGLSISNAGVATITLEGQTTISMTTTAYAAAVTFDFQRSQGTRATPTAITTNAVISQWRFRGFDGAAYRNSVSLNGTVIAPTPSATDMAGRFSMLCTPLGSVTITEVIRLEFDTGLSMFGANPVIDQNRHFKMRSYTVAGSPAASSNTDKSIAQSDAPGGDSQAFSDGTNWLNPIYRNRTTNLTVGYTSTANNIGTQSSGTLTPNPALGNLQYVIDNGAFILAAPTATGDYSIVLEVVNGATAGAITYTGWTRNPHGDALDTVNGHIFRFFITKINGHTSATIEALQ
jgi:hypothetical protein